MRYYFLLQLIVMLVAIVAGSGLAAAESRNPLLKLQRVSDKAPQGYIQFKNVGAGPFDPSIWIQGNLNLHHDFQSPLLEPLQGNNRNIYAPSIVELPAKEGWRVFYGAWDGTPDGHDRIYSVVTKDFRTFTDRHTVIEHGPFHHVCNVNALRLADGTYIMVCTAYPDADGLNKPIIFRSRDGKKWNGSATPYTPSTSDLITMTGYKDFAGADINGMNVILQEDGVFRMYFGDFKDFDGVHRASSADAKNFTYDQAALKKSLAVNDVKKFLVKGKWHYLMGLHMNGDTLWYSLSEDGSSFASVQTLATNLGEADRYIVAIGWVVNGEQDAEGRRLLGFLYGAGSHSSLTKNRIFARWLQKSVELVMEDGSVIKPQWANGPDALLAPLTDGQTFKARVRVLAEDGKRLLSESGPVTLKSGETYNLKW